MATNYGKYIRFVLIAIIVVLFNIASTSIFFRGDLTRNKVYTLSKASRDAVADLEEPLTIKAFFSKNLPSPYSNTAQQVRDLLEEYALSSNQFFNYTIHSIGSEEGLKNDKDLEYEENARSYRIYPVQIQNIERDEVKLQTVYMGLAIIHGDMLETIPALTDSERLEYQITSHIIRLAKKMSALINLEENIHVKLYLSSNLYPLGESLRELPAEIQDIVDNLNREHYNRLRFNHIDPVQAGNINSSTIDDIERYRLASITIKTSDDPSEHGEKAYASLVIVTTDQAHTLDLISRGIFGYQISDITTIESAIKDSTEALLNINETIGYLADHGTPALVRSSTLVLEDSTSEVSLGNFNSLITQNYTFRPINLKEEMIPEGLETLMIVGPQEEFSDYALYKLDQFLMKGNSLLLFLDAFDIVLPEEQQYLYGQSPIYIPRTTGLEKMLEYYGVKLKSAYVLDEQCYIQRQRLPDNSYAESPVYFAPMITKKYINQSLPYLQNLTDMIMLTVSPLELVEELPTGAKAHQLFSTSDNAWEVTENINLSNPVFSTPPPEEERKIFPLAYILEGGFPSYFAEKALPSPQEDTETETQGEQEEDRYAEGSAAEIISAEELAVEGSFLAQGGGGRIFIIGSSEVLGDTLFDAGGASANSIFVQNTIDHMTGNDELTIMRNKGITYVPLEETEPAASTFIKTFNIVGLPIIVILIGVLVWLSRISWRNQLQRVFGPSGIDAAQQTAPQSGLESEEKRK